MKFECVIDKLLKSSEPSIHFKTRVNVLDEDPDSKGIKKLQDEIKKNSRVKKLLSNQDRSGKIVSAKNIYDKWQGAHWILATLADIGYPPKDPSLFPARDEVLDFWLRDFFYKEFEATTKSDVYKKDGVPVIQGRYRRCAFQQGYTLYYLIKLDIADDRVHKLVERLLHWQWPDGGWNCDKNPSASKSSFIHTTWTLRGLAQYAARYNDGKVKEAVIKASEVLLKRNLYKRITNGKVIHTEFISLHYPLYWHYDILGGLKVIAEADLVKDNRCSEALDLLEKKVLAEGGWPAEKRYYKVSDEIKLGNDYVDWGGTGKSKMNEWITADALFVLKKAGRLN